MKNKDMKTFHIHFLRISAIVWEWLEAHVSDFPKVMPPTFDINMKRVLIETINGYAKLTPAQLVNDFVIGSIDDYVYITPVVNNIVLYQDAYKHMMKVSFDDKCPGTILSALISHDILHEILHYCDMWKEYTKECDDRQVVMDEFYNYVVSLQEETYEHELQNEAITMRLFEMMMAGKDDVVSLKELRHNYKKGRTDPSIMMPKANSPFMDYLKHTQPDIYAGYLALLYRYCASNIKTSFNNYGTDRNMHRYIYNAVTEMWNTNPEKIEFHRT